MFRVGVDPIEFSGRFCSCVIQRALFENDFVQVFPSTTTTTELHPNTMRVMSATNIKIKHIHPPKSRPVRLDLQRCG